MIIYVAMRSKLTYISTIYNIYVQSLENLIITPMKTYIYPTGVVNNTLALSQML